MTTVDISITREIKTDPLVLVTGAAGFIGSAVVSRLSNLGYQVVAVDALLGGLYPREEKAIKFEQLEILYLHALFKGYFINTELLCRIKVLSGYLQFCCR